MDARVLFSFDNPPVNVIGKPKVKAYAVFERPWLRPQGQEKCRSPPSVPRRRDSQKTNKRLEGQRLLFFFFEVLTEDLAQIV